MKFLSLVNPWVGIVLAGALVALIGFAHYKYSRHYIDKGRAEVQAKWDAQTAANKKSYDEAFVAAVEKARKLQSQGQVLSQQQISGVDDERRSLRITIDNDRRKPRRMREYPAETGTPDTDMPGDTAGASQPVAACNTRLPAALGAGFEELRETVVRIGSEANEVAITHNKAAEEREGLVPTD